MKKISLLFVIMLLHYTIINAQWSNDPNLNTPVCLALGDQINPLIISDGKNGAIICWMNSTNSQIYVQRLDSLGYKMWDTSGVRVSQFSNNSGNQKFISDEEGGAIITWESFNNGDEDIFAQRIDALGNLLWDTLGVEICVNPLDQQRPIITSDGVGGAIIVWEDLWSGLGVCGIYAQRINSNGEVLWASNGIPVCTSAFQDPTQHNPNIVCDGQEGVIVVWDDIRPFDDHIYAQRIDANGVIQWITNGIQISQISGEDRIQGITKTSENEFILAWTNGFSAFSETNIYAQKIDTTGLIKWNPYGVPICVSNGNQRSCVIAIDSTSGAILAWDDFRSGGIGVYAQKIDSAGTLKWQVNGIPIAATTSYQWQPRIVCDENNHALISWVDMVGDNINISAQKTDENGLLMWGAGGSPISIAKADRIDMVSDGMGGAILTWDDRRNGDNNKDIFAQRIDGSGNLSITSLKEEIILSFQNGFTLIQNYPNPFNPSTTIKFSLPFSGYTTLKIYNALGEEVAILLDKELTTGFYNVEWNAADLTSGVYFYRLQAGSFVQTRKMILLK